MALARTISREPDKVSCHHRTRYLQLQYRIERFIARGLHANGAFGFSLAISQRRVRLGDFGIGLRGMT